MSRYSEKFLALIASFDNSGKPEGFNCRCTVGKSKRGEIFVRLFARVNPRTRVIEAAGFKAHGCLAIIGCASMACTLAEGRTLSQALEITVDELSEAVGGVPEEKHNTLYIAVESVRALVGDYLLREGASLAELDASVPCSPYSVACTMCEHCSLRDGRIDKQVAEIRQQEEREERNAVARTLMQVRADSAAGRLSTPQGWQEAGLVPAHMTPQELGESCAKAVAAWKAEHPTEHEEPAEGSPTAAGEPVHAAARRSRFAPRAVGIPSFLRNDEPPQPEEQEAPEQNQPAAYEKAAGRAPQKQPAAQTVLVEEGPFAGLRIPAGTELCQVDGEWVLVETGERPQERELVADPSGIECLRGSDGALYLYDTALMTDSFARWAFLAAQDNPLDTFAECIREESRTYPRPLSARCLRNDPICLSAEQVEEAWQQASEDEDYADIQRTQASDGSVYYYSTSYLSCQQASALAEWDAVGRYMNV
ncbi:MAG: iron-sulfur cluster assembly scaffold protein [Coriobacteriales bacterium]